jgi:transcriptional regulator with XRE-family HTH domain
MDISEQIKYFRKQRTLTQADMAKLMHMTQSNYALLENGKTELTYNKMQKLAEIFGVSVEDLVKTGGSLTTPHQQVETLQNEITTLQQRLAEKDNLLKRLEKDEQQYLTAINRLVESLYIAFEKWYKNQADMISEQDATFWEQFFLFRGNTFAFDANLVQDAFFTRMYEKYKYNTHKFQTPFETKEKEL